VLRGQQVRVDYIHISPGNLPTKTAARLPVPLIYREKVYIEGNAVRLVPVPQADSHRVAILPTRQRQNPTDFTGFKPRENVSLKKQIQLVAKRIDRIDTPSAT
jgi:hypothetical protein